MGHQALEFTTRHFAIKCLVWSLCFFFLALPAHASEKIITLSDGAKAIVYEPNGFRQKKRYPMLMVLHGIKETAQATLQTWKPVADAFKMILVCPVGSNFEHAYTRRKPRDDRYSFVQFRQHLDQTYNIDCAKSVLIGFSRGGSFAIETGLLYPTKFKNVVCIFGFYTGSKPYIAPSLKKNHTQRLYKHTKFYLITGKGDLTQASLTYAKSALEKHKIKTKLKTFPKLIHSYPKNLIAEFRNIQKFFAH